MMRSIDRPARWKNAHVGLLVILTVVFAVRPAHAQLTGISYTLTPMAERVRFGDNAGITDGYLYGGRLGFGFGEYAELSGAYLRGHDLSTDFTGFTAIPDEYRDAFEFLPTRAIGLSQYGALLKFNFGTGSITPFVTAGTGILEFDPDNLPTAQVVYLSGSAGLQYGLTPNFALLAEIRSMTYRYAPATTLLSEADLFDVGLSGRDIGHVRANNFSLRLGVQLYAGGRARGQLTDVDRALRDQFAHGITGVRLQVEPIAGIIDFKPELGFRNRQRIGGVQAGFDLGPYLGVRGFYWRGIEEDAYTKFDHLQAYGGELQLSFSGLSQMFIPRIVLGGGYLDVLDDYVGNDVVVASDRPFASGGAELTIPIGESFRLHGGIRALLMADDDPETVSGPSEISVNYMYSAGISFGIGGRRTPARYDAPRESGYATPPAPVGRASDPELARLNRQIDSLVAVSRAMQQGDAQTLPSAAGYSVDGNGRRWVTLPVPERGELYVRYGDSTATSFGAAQPQVIYVDPATGAPRTDVTTAPGAAPTSPAEIARIVREVLRSELGQAPARQFEATSSTERRLLDRIAELEARLSALQDGRTATPYPVAVRERAPGYRLDAVMPFAGIGFAREQIGLIGLRASVQSLSVSGLRFLPDVTAAFGSDEMSFALNVNVGFPLGIQVGAFRPYAGLGLGLITTGNSQLVFNMLVGAEQVLPYGRLFGEYMSQDFFDLNRFVVGYRFSF